MIQENVVEFRKEMTDYINCIRERSHRTYLRPLAIKRKFDADLLFDKVGMIYIGEMAEMLIPKYLNKLEDFGVIAEVNKKPIFKDRYLIPLYDLKGLVQGVVGYSMTSTARYVYSTTKYFQRGDFLYNSQCYKKCLENGYVIVTEGITDAIRLMHLGFECVMSTAGAHESAFAMQILDSDIPVIFIPDRDSTGMKTKEYWRTRSYVRVMIPPLKYKDIDEWVATEIEKKELIINYLYMIIDYVKEKHAKREPMLGEEIPMYI